MILIADSGSTKTEWVLIDETGEIQERFVSLGYNPNYVSASEIREDIFASLPASFPLSAVREVNFYGAGVSEPEYPFMSEVLGSVFREAVTIFVAMDLLASARALLGRKAGFAAILGTGANTCLYDGEKETMNIDSLGFILGDEGSGGYIGKSLLRDYMRGNMPAEIYSDVRELTGKSIDEIIEQVYRKPKANRYCAQFCKWVAERRHSHPYCRDLILNAFRDFFRNIVCLYPNHTAYSFNCVGSVAYHCSDLLTQVAREFGMEPGVILQSPMEGLIRFHTPDSH